MDQKTRESLKDGKGVSNWRKDVLFLQDLDRSTIQEMKDYALAEALMEIIFGAKE